MRCKRQILPYLAHNLEIRIHHSPYFQINSCQNVNSSPKNNKIAHISVHDISKAGIVQNASSPTFSIILLEIFRIRVELNSVLKSGADFLLRPQKNLVTKSACTLLVLAS
jgi:hypothetical protein